MDASVTDLLICIGTWAMPIAILGLLCLFGDEAGADAAGTPSR